MSRLQNFKQFEIKNASHITGGSGRGKIISRGWKYLKDTGIILAIEEGLRAGWDAVANWEPDFSSEEAYGKWLLEHNSPGGHK